MPACQGCRFYDDSFGLDDKEADGVDITGRCRRHAPHPLAVTQLDEGCDMEAVWPEVHRLYDWCGDWAART